MLINSLEPVGSNKLINKARLNLAYMLSFNALQKYIGLALASEMLCEIYRAIREVQFGSAHSGPNWLKKSCCIQLKKSVVSNLTIHCPFVPYSFASLYKLYCKAVLHKMMRKTNQIKIFLSKKLYSYEGFNRKMWHFKTESTTAQ